MSNVGFIPTGTGPKGARFGRGSDGRAFKADGTLRKARRTLTTAEKMVALAAMAAGAFAGIGRSVMRALTGFATFRATVGTFRKWVRDAKAYGTPEAIAARKAYFLNMAAKCDAKGRAAAKFLPGAAAAISAIDGLYGNIGKALAEFREKHGRDANPAECEAIVAGLLTPDVRALVESAGDPANDPFAEFRRDAADADLSPAEDEDTLDSEDEDEDEDDRE